MSDDHSPGDARKPYADRGGPAGRHAQTHDARREALTNPRGPEPDEEDFDADLGRDSAGDASPSYADESTPAVDDKVVHARLPSLNDAELSRLAVLEPGTRLEQGSTYLDLNDLGRGPFKAIGGQEATQRTRYISKRDTDYEMWNRITDGDDEPEVERPESVSEE